MKDYPKTIIALEINSRLYDALFAIQEAQRKYPCAEFTAIHRKIDKTISFCINMKQKIQHQEDEDNYGNRS